MEPFQKSLIIGSLLLALSIVGSKASSRFGIPALLLFLGIGIAAGSHVLGAVVFNDYPAAQHIGVFALIFILFAGGLNTKLESVVRVLKPALVLATAGVIAASVLVGLFAHLFMGFSWLEGFSARCYGFFDRCRRGL